MADADENQRPLLAGDRGIGPVLPVADPQLRNSVRIDEKWDAVIDFVDALAANPPRAEGSHATRLRELGFTDADLHDLVLSAASFSWANRLMLTLGEPEVPA
ncbi:hypothetical protein JK358_15850 [Nocardia sp. 2]|uniref:Peroxidase n=1 Tax=Nocardia acididurans TaxID=2802282 RepID=A0ABS1M744_9NOCA|nr:hypothetical protein [Nocardia acididurans]MBL1075870.1 hypothetical protein [Nocardia acididurans]